MLRKDFTNREIIKATGTSRCAVQYYRHKLEKGAEINVSSNIGSIKPRIIVHGGAGNITRDNLPPERLEEYRASLTNALKKARELLGMNHVTALDVAVATVATLEDDPLFNCGKGAVFTRAGTIELEASVMVSNGYRKRGVGCSLLMHVKNPIKLAREMLVRGEGADGGGAYGHCQLSGQELEDLAEDWNLDIVNEDYFWTKRRWDEHRRGLDKEAEEAKDAEQHRCRGQGGKLWCGQCWRKSAQDESARTTEKDMEGGKYGPGWDGHEYLPQGTVGVVVLDRFGTIAVATSTGGLTNKLPGRIGDTPSLGAGFWAEEWEEEMVQSLQPHSSPQMIYEQPSAPDHSLFDQLSRGDVFRLLSGCLPSPSPLAARSQQRHQKQQEKAKKARHAVAMSGTGNGDSFLRLNAVRTAAAMSRFSSPNSSLQKCVSQMAGPDGELQKSAGDRWGKTGEGESGIIGIELKDQESEVVWDFNCGGMFRAFIDDGGNEVFGCFREDQENSTHVSTSKLSN
jgi:L-asparaginase